MRNELFDNIISGVASVMEIYPDTPEKNPLTIKSDSERLAEDWTKVGNDLYSAIDQINQEIKPSK